MKTIIQGKNITTIYNVDHKWTEIKDEDGIFKNVYTAKPELTKETNIDNWETIYEVDGTIEYNQIPKKIDYILSFNMIPTVGTINLSETEEVKIIEKIFRADLNSVVLHTDKILKENEFYKEQAMDILDCQIKAFNKMMIESNEGLLAYCKLHKLNVEETDVDELFKVVYPNQNYIIEHGKLLVLNTGTIKASGFTYGGVTTGDYGVLTTNSVISATNIYNAR